MCGELLFILIPSVIVMFITFIICFEESKDIELIIFAPIIMGLLILIFMLFISVFVGLFLRPSYEIVETEISELYPLCIQGEIQDYYFDYTDDTSRVILNLGNEQGEYWVSTIVKSDKNLFVTTKRVYENDGVDSIFINFWNNATTKRTLYIKEE